MPDPVLEAEQFAEQFTAEPEAEWQIYAPTQDDLPYDDLPSMMTFRWKPCVTSCKWISWWMLI